MLIRPWGITSLDLRWRWQTDRVRGAWFAARLPHRLKGDPLAMWGLRSLLLEGRSSVDLSRLTDDEVLREVAVLLARGVLILVEDRVPMTAPRAAPGAAAKPALPPEPALPPSRTRQDREEPDTFAPDFPMAAQAMAMVAAAGRGVALCDT